MKHLIGLKKLDYIIKNVFFNLFEDQIEFSETKLYNSVLRNSTIYH